jgi:pyruvate/2-oxoglutarate dehydrogenase complex dihydrolipoamide acyltransferase (E2) component
MATDVTVPTLGESITEATLGQWLKQPGETVKVDEPIASLETDKVAVEVPSPVAGVIGELVVAEGDTVSVGRCVRADQRDAGRGKPHGGRQGGSGCSTRARRRASRAGDAGGLWQSWRGCGGR